MKKYKWVGGFLVLAILLTGALKAGEPVDLDALMKIRDEGFSNSMVMDIAGYLCDVIGPRLTGSPQNKKAHEWARQKMESWGLVNSHIESWPFGRGWSVQHVAVHMLSPEPSPLLAWPRAWTPGTQGPVRGKIMQVKLNHEEDLRKYKGQLAGRILLIGEMTELKVHDKPDSNRLTDQQLEGIKNYSFSRGRAGVTPEEREEALKKIKFQKLLRQFYQDEKALAVIEPAQSDGGTLRNLRGGDYKPGETFPIPSLMLSAEHYNRLLRLLDRKIEPELELDVQTIFYDDDTKSYNTIAELPGSNKRDEIVMLGAHLDSWHLGTGATDDAAGCAVAMEAMRILKMSGVKLRRIVRIGLWSGEEQGFLGSKDYVSRHFAALPPNLKPEEKDLPSFLRSQEGPLDFKSEYSKFSVYFNLDNGGGKIRGIYAQNNLPAAALFESWLKPLADLGASTVTVNRTGGTDHLAFNSVGLPGFQFIQDDLEYGSRTWHTNMDVYDRLQKEDLMQASVIMASFVYDAATQTELFPRRPLPDNLVRRSDPTKQ